ncbi:ABC transporter substrate-binding protein [Deinococcus marmoris]|uniref:Extracellular solute-binding protein, family 1 n=1 Tax=Deinococcus marmoris TaxID=249408 RepID=A0A1U7NU25_9DEIO|nr:extracellular solute-binding protein [Deinococcus marmoris]OLV16428.1 extracellular solute-binding protein, family 1 [Deinococcus marmoris]
MIKLTKSFPLVLTLALSVAAAQTLELYNDKPDWNNNYTKVGDLGAKSGAGFKGVTFADPSTYQAAVRTSLSTSKAPAMFTWWSGYRMKDLVESGTLQDLTPIWQKYQKAGEYGSDLAKAFTFDGKIYALPNNVAYWAVFYNKKAYKDAGITPPTTWAQLESNNAKLKARGVTAFGQSVEDRWPAFIWFEEFLTRQDPDLYERLMVGKAKYTDPGVTKVFTTWKGWMDKGYFTPASTGFGSGGTNGMAKLFAQGKLANILAGDWYTATIAGTGMKPGDDYGVFILPTMNAKARPVIIYEASPLIVSKNAANKAQALKVADFWMSAKAQTLWSNLQSFTPVNNEVTVDNPVTKELTSALSKSKPRLINRIWEATPTEIIEPGVDELSKFMLDPSTQTQVQANLQKLADAYWSKQK